MTGVGPAYSLWIPLICATVPTVPELLCTQALRAACPHNVEVQLVQAGHCPHDEAPTLVNAALEEFLSSRVKASPGQPVPVLG